MNSGIHSPYQALEAIGAGVRFSTANYLPKHQIQGKTPLSVDGCFWHGCPVHGTQPRSNAKFWREKIARNKARDHRVTRTLRARGWRVLRVWEHALARSAERRLLARLHRELGAGVSP